MIRNEWRGDHCSIQQSLFGQLPRYANFIFSLTPKIYISEKRLSQKDIRLRYLPVLNVSPEKPPFFSLFGDTSN